VALRTCVVAVLGMPPHSPRCLLPPPQPSHKLDAGAQYCSTLIQL
jgi:hypothetical protein